MIFLKLLIKPIESILIEKKLKHWNKVIIGKRSKSLCNSSKLPKFTSQVKLKANLRSLLYKYPDVIKGNWLKFSIFDFRSINQSYNDEDPSGF